ncbi:MAG: HDIG domain-containing protein [Patescibacteria group bacterium]|nr:HDIG domain-containing protein [Patescibacteria group bacterium]
MTREQALNFLHKHVKNQNLRRHCYAVEAVMRALARRFNENEEVWGIAGLLHDADYEETKEDMRAKHTKLLMQWLLDFAVDSDIKDAILAHGWGYVNDAPMPRTKMQWALYCCDELTGLIVAVALVMKDKRLSSVSVDSVVKKFSEKSFAKGANREQIKKCESALGIQLNDFVSIALAAMKSVSPELGL